MANIGKIFTGIGAGLTETSNMLIEAKKRKEDAEVQKQQLDALKQQYQMTGMNAAFNQLDRITSLAGTDSAYAKKYAALPQVKSMVLKGLGGDNGFSDNDYDQIVELSTTKGGSANIKNALKLGRLVMQGTIDDSKLTSEDKTFVEAATANDWKTMISVSPFVSDAFTLKAKLSTEGGDAEKRTAELARIKALTKKAEAETKLAESRPNISKSQEALDTKFSTEYADFVSLGGIAEVNKGLVQLKEAETELGKRTGELTGPIRGLLPDKARQITNPKAVAVKDNVLSVVQRNLRLILGSAFTEKEGEKVLNRSWNDSLPEAENLKRVKRLSKQIREAAQAKLEAGEYFEKNGTLKGFKGNLVTSATDFLKGLEEEEEKPKELPKGAVATNANGTVKMKGPDGRLFAIPTAKVDDAKSKGYEVME